MSGKSCNCCGEWKDRSEFHKDSAQRDGLKRTCKTCAALQSKRYAERFPERRAASKRRWALANPEAGRRAVERWREANAGSDSTYHRDYYRKNYQRDYARLLMKWAMRKQWCRQATPAWADLKKIAGIYQQAGRMKQAGFDVHVDHIIPLRGDTVSGLHVHNNLRVIPAKDNLVKSNRLLHCA